MTTGDSTLDMIVIVLLSVFTLAVISGILSYIKNRNCKCNKFEMLDEKVYYNSCLKPYTIYKFKCVECSKVKTREVESED